MTASAVPAAIVAPARTIAPRCEWPRLRAASSSPRRLPHERGADEQVHVRIEDEREHGDRAAGGPQVGQPRAAPEDVAQHALHEARLVVLAEQHERQHVGGHREREHERPRSRACAAAGSRRTSRAPPARCRARGCPRRRPPRGRACARAPRGAGRARSAPRRRPGPGSSAAGPAAAPRRRPRPAGTRRRPGRSAPPPTPPGLHERDRRGLSLAGAGTRRSGPC